MRYIISLCIFLWLPQCLLAQTLPVLPQNKKPETATNPKAIIAKRLSVKTKETKVIHFYDDFYDNKNSWDLVSDSIEEISIFNGKLKMKGISHGYWYRCSRDFGVDVTKDFSCSVTVKWIEGDQTSGFGLEYCSSLIMNSQCEFSITPNGYYHIIYNENGGEWKKLKDWMQSSFVNKGTIPNILRIKKEGAYIDFYINDNLVETFPYDVGFGDNFGLKVWDNQTVEFDNFDLKGIRIK